MDKPIVSKNLSIALKGVFCIFVLLHHLIRTGNQFIDSILHILGPIAVGGFFFISGYGLVVNYIKFGKAYLKKLISKRIPIIYGIIVLVNIVYLIYFLLSTPAELSFLNIFASVFYLSFLDAFVPLYSWIYFLVDLLTYYIVFALVFMVIELIKNINKKPQASAVILTIVFFLVFIIVSLINGYYLDRRAIFCFVLGVLLSAFEQKLLMLTPKIKLIFSIILITAFILLFALFNTYLVSEQILPLIFCIIVATILAYHTPTIKPILFMGEICLYVYLTHGLFFEIINKYSSLSPYLRAVIVCVITVVISYLLYLLVDGIKRKKIKSFKNKN